MFNFIKIILATNFTDIFSNLFSNSNNFNNITNLDINKNVNSDIEYYSINNLKNVKNINNLHNSTSSEIYSNLNIFANTNNLNNISSHIIDVTNNVTNILFKVINDNLSNIESNIINDSYLILKSSENTNSNQDIEKNITDSNILTGFIVGMVICIFACAFIRLCSVNICFTCLKNSLKCIIYIPRKICKLCFSNKVDEEETRDDYNVIN